jgi:hypothetical protein
MTSYTFTSLANGTYHVDLLMAEEYWTGSGQRVFSAAAEGQDIFTDLDLFVAASGANKAITRSIDVIVSDGTLNLTFTSTVDQAKVDAIYIVNTAAVVPAAPVLSGTLGNTVDDLAWTFIAGASSYTLKRGATTIYSGANRTYHDTGLTNGTAYNYTVMATTTGGTSSASNTVTLTPTAGVIRNLIFNSPMTSVNPITQEGWAYTLEAGPNMVEGSRITRQLDPAGGGGYVRRFQALITDWPSGTSTGHRSQLDSSILVNDGDTQWTHFELYMPGALPRLGGSAFWGFQEWMANSDNDSPHTGVLAMRADDDNLTNARMCFAAGSWFGYQEFWSAPVSPLVNTWQSYTLGIHFTAASSGWLEIWLNGVRQTLTLPTQGGGFLSNGNTRYNGPTFRPDGSESNAYLVMTNYWGYGADGWVSSTTTYVRNVRVGPTYADVA